MKFLSEKNNILPVTREKAEMGDAFAQYDLGMSYLEGDGVEKNVEEGVRWLKKSAENCLEAAQVAMGKL